MWYDQIMDILSCNISVDSEICMLLYKLVKGWQDDVLSACLLAIA